MLNNISAKLSKKGDHKEISSQRGRMQSILPKIICEADFLYSRKITPKSGRTAGSFEHNATGILFFDNLRSRFSCIFSALCLHIVSMYFVAFIQSIAYPLCSDVIYMLLKFILRWFYLLVPVCFMKVEKIKLADIGITKNKLFVQIFTGLLIGCVEVVVIVGLTVLLGFKQQLGSPLYEEGWQYIIYFFYAIFAVGLFEEIFFRGYLYKKLSDVLKSQWLVMVISSNIFGMCHFVGNGNFLQDIPQVLLSTISGMFYCLLRVKIKNCTLISLIVMHGIYDFGIAFLVFI